MAECRAALAQWLEQWSYIGLPVSGSELAMGPKFELVEILGCGISWLPDVHSLFFLPSFSATESFGRNLIATDAHLLIMSPT